MKSFIFLFLSFFTINAMAALTYTDPNGNNFNITLAQGQSTQLEIQIDSDDVTDEITATKTFGSGITFNTQCIQVFSTGNESCLSTVTISSTAAGNKRVQFEGNTGRKRITFRINRTASATTINPSNYDNSFAALPSQNIDLGTVSDTVLQTIYIQNTSGSPSDELAPLITDQTGFAVVSDTCSGRIIGAGNSCRLIVEFSADPLFAGDHTQEFRIHPVGDNSAPYVLSVSANVAEPPRAKTEVLAGFTKVDPASCLALSPSDPSLCYYESDGFQESTEVGSVFCNPDGDCSVAITKRLANEPVEFLIAVNFPDSTVTGQNPANFDFSLTPETDNAGQVLLGQKITRSILLTNLGPASLPIPITVSPTVSGGVAAVLVNNGCAALATPLDVGETCSINVDITPVLQGTTVVSLDVDTVIDGVSKTATITTTTDSTGLDFLASPSNPTIGINSNDTTQITITNTSSINQNIDRPLAVNLSGTGLAVNPTNSSCLNVSTGLAQNDSCTIEIVNSSGVSAQFPQIASISSSGITKNITIDSNTILHNLTINFTENPSGTAGESVQVYYTSPSQLIQDCTTPTCNLIIEEGRTISINPQAAPNSQITFPGGDCDGSFIACNLTMDADKVVNVVMANLPPLTLTPTNPADVNSGDTAQFTAGGGLPGYSYSIQGGSTIGSTIDSNGLYTAGNNSTGSTVVETVRVADAKGNSTTVAINVLYSVPTYQLTINFIPYTDSSDGFTPDQVVVGSPEFENPIGTPCLSGTCVYTITGGNQAVIQAQYGYLGSFGVGVKSRIKSWGGECSSVSTSNNLCVIPNIQEDKTVNIEMEYINGPPEITPNPVADVTFGDTIQFDISGGDTVAVNYEIVGGSTIGSTIVGGLYTAGDNQTGSTVVETVRATDNQGASDEVSFNVLETPAPAGVDITLSSNSINFGNVFINQVRTEIIQITNTGSESINLPLTLSSSSKFSLQSSGCGVGGVLPAGTSCDLSISFSSSAQETVSETLTITATDGTDSEDESVSLSAQTQPVSPNAAIALSVSSINFGTLQKETGTNSYGEAKEARVTVTNVGGEAIEAYQFSLNNSSGPNNTSLHAISKSSWSGPNNAGEYEFGCGDFGALETGQSCEIYIAINSESATAGPSQTVSAQIEMYARGTGNSATASLNISAAVTEGSFKTRPQNITVDLNREVRIVAVGGTAPYTAQITSGVGTVSNVSVEIPQNQTNAQHEVYVARFSSPIAGTSTITLTDSLGATASSTVVVNNQFGVGGTIVNNLLNPSYSLNVFANGAGVADDGIYLEPNFVSVGSGRRFGLVKYLGTGQKDFNFGTQGRTEDLHFQMSTNFPNCSVFGVPFCNPDYTLPSTFSVYNHVVRDDSGNIYVVGSINETGAVRAEDFYIIKYNSNGDIDNSFGVNGEAIIQDPTENDTTIIYGESAYAAVYHNGKLFITGARSYQTPQNESDLVLLSIDANTGALNTSDNSGGYLVFDTNNETFFHTLIDEGQNDTGSDDIYQKALGEISMTSSGDILIAARGGNVVLERAGQAPQIRNTKIIGKLDTSLNFISGFGSDGDGFARDYLLPYGGPGAGGSPGLPLKVFVEGEAYYLVHKRNDNNPPTVFGLQTFQFVLRKYTAGGSLDTSFGNGGEAIIGNNDDNYSYISNDQVVRQPDGKFVFLSTFYWGRDQNNYGIRITRMNTDGTFDSSFGPNGVKDIKLGTDSINYNRIRVTNEAIYISGSHTGFFEPEIYNIPGFSGASTRIDFGVQGNVSRMSVMQLDINTGEPFSGTFEDLIKIGYTCQEKGDFNSQTGLCECDPGYENTFESGYGYSCTREAALNCEDASAGSGGSWTGTSCDCGGAAGGTIWDGASCSENFEVNDCISNGGNYNGEFGECQCPVGYIQDPSNSYACLEDQRVQDCQNAGGTWDANSEYCSGLPAGNFVTDTEYFDDSTACDNVNNVFDCQDCFDNQGGYIWDDDNFTCAYGCNEAYDFVTCQQYGDAGLGCYWDPEFQECY